MKPDISVVIPTFNRGHVLIDTINDVLAQNHTNFELIIVDQTLNIDKLVKSKIEGIKDSRLRYFKVGPPSVTAAKNFALKVAKSDIALFIDDDVKLPDNFIQNHLKAYKKHPEISAVAGRVMQKGFPIEKNVLKFNDLAVSIGVFTATKESYTNAFPGGNCSMKVSDALSVGGFDTRYYGNFFREESDMSMKMSKAGMKIFYEPSAELLHLAAPRGGTRTVAYTDIRDTPMFYRNELFFTLRMADRKIAALKHKFNEYCKIGGAVHKRRAVKYLLGILAAYWRMIFNNQITASEHLK